MRRLPALLATLLLLACGDQPDQPARPTDGKLPSGVVARVGSSDIHVDTIVGIAAIQGVPLKQARDSAVYDALFAEGARAELAASEVAAAETRVLARVLVRALWHEAKAAPVTPAELSAAKLRNWTHVDRPQGFRVVHVVARVDEKDDADKRERARELAERLREAVEPAAAIARDKPAPEADDERLFRANKRPVDPAVAPFRKAAQSVDAGDISLNIEESHVVAADGSVIDHDAPPGYTYVLPFAKAAAALGERGRGALSEVVETSFGYHVLMLLQVTPEKRLPQPQLLEALTPEIVRRRGAKAEGQLLERLAQQHGVAVMANSDALMARVRASEGDAAEIPTTAGP